MKRRILSIFMGIAVVTVFVGTINAYPSKYIAVLNAAQTTPISNSVGHGFCRAAMTSDWWGPYAGASNLEVICDFSGLTGTLMAADIVDAHPGQNGVSVCDPFSATVSLPNNGSGRLTLNCSYFEGGEESLLPGLAYHKGLSVILKTSNFPNGEIRGQIKPVTLDLDVNGEGRSEMSIFRPVDTTAYSFCGLSNGAIAKKLNWQPATDSTPFLADFDGDGIADWTFIRTAESGALIWTTLRSSDSQTTGMGFGLATAGDIPVYGDFTGDGTADRGIFRSTTGQWYGLGSYWGQIWGQPGDKPCVADYDGDGRTDLCTVRSESGQLYWYIRYSQFGPAPRLPWGIESDTLFPNDRVDLDGDGYNDPLIARIENGRRVFYGLRSSNQSMFVQQWGLVSDGAKLGDYDGDGKTDFAAVRETDGHLVWYIYQSSDETMRTHVWGIPGDK